MGKLILQSLKTAAGLVVGGFLTWQIVLPWAIVGAVIWGISSLIAGCLLNPLYWFFGQLGVTFLAVFGVMLGILVKSRRQSRRHRF